MNSEQIKGLVEKKKLKKLCMDMISRCAVSTDAVLHPEFPWLQTRLTTVRNPMHKTCIPSCAWS